MLGLPPLSGKEVTKEGEMASLSIPNHSAVAKGTLRSLIRSARISVDEFTAVIYAT